MPDNPFTTLGLPMTARLSDDDVRAAWRRIAAATHPDRDDGGDPARFGVAAAAYVQLRTAFGRGEAVADLGGEPAVRGRPGRRGGAHRARPARAGGRAATRAWNWVPAGARLSGAAGRRLVALVGGAGAMAAATMAAVGLTPATVGLLAGALTVAGWALWRQRGG